MKKSTHSISYLEILTVVFITLKLCGVIDWSWWWVTSPMWGSVLFIIFCVTILCVMGEDPRDVFKK